MDLTPCAPRIGGGGSSYIIPFYSIQPGDGIYAHMVSQRKFIVRDGCDIAAAVSAAKSAQVAIVMVGDDETESQDHSIRLSGTQDQLVSAVAAANPHTIVVLKSGSAVLMPWLSAVPAVLEAWYPGEEDGNAVADVLFGNVDPSGKLPLTFPAGVDQTLARNPEQFPGENDAVTYSEGLAVGYRDYQVNKTKPLFPFGFGLSYTSFAFSNLSLSQSSIPSGDTIHLKVSFRIINTGKRPGAEVPQIYIGFPPIPEGNEPPLQLKGFAKVMLQPGESKTITVPLDARSFSYWSTRASSWQIEKGTYKIALAASSEDIRETRTVTVR